MNTYIRYFCSQHVGKARATVMFDGVAAGHVRIDLPSSPQTSVAFSFTESRLQQMVPDRQRWDETLTRIAIHQLHNRLASDGRNGLENATLELALETAPWHGDLAEAPYGGATTGYAARPR